MCTGVSIEQWRASVGVMSSLAHKWRVKGVRRGGGAMSSRKMNNENKSKNETFPNPSGGGKGVESRWSLGGAHLLLVLSFLLVFASLQLLTCGDVERNPGPTHPLSLTAELNEDNLPYLVNVLDPVAYKGDKLGLQIGVPNHEIERIKGECPLNLKNQLKEFLVTRLSQPEPLTLQHIVIALQSSYVRQPRLARSIQSQYTAANQATASTASPTKQQVLPSHHIMKHTASSSAPTSDPTPSGSGQSVFGRVFSGVKSMFQSRPEVDPPHNYNSDNPTYSISSVDLSPPPAKVARYSSPNIGSTSEHHPVPIQSPLATSLDTKQQVLPSHHVRQHTASSSANNSDPTPSASAQSIIGKYFSGVKSTPRPELNQVPTPHSDDPTSSKPSLDLSPPPAKVARYSTSYTASTSRHTPVPIQSPLATSLDNQTSVSKASPPDRSPMSRFIEYVKTKYRKSKVERKQDVLKWPPTPSVKFINVVCVDRECKISRGEEDECTRAMVVSGSLDVVQGKKTPINLSDIAKDVPAEGGKKLVLVKGAPGVGKSTLAWEFCRRWERGEIAGQYRLVLLLRLRDQRMSKAKCLGDLIYHPIQELAEAVCKELLETSGEGVLIIIEGFDELPVSCRSKTSVFFQLIEGELLPQATVLVTSRPWATSEIHLQCEDCLHQHIEILGFNQTQIEEYVESVFNDTKAKNPGTLAKELMSYVKVYPQIHASMYIPLNAAIVVSVFQENIGERSTLPRTLTELYTALLHTLLLRYLKGHSVYGEKSWKIRSLKDDLPKDVYSQLLQISELAYNGIFGKGYEQLEEVQLVFSDLLSNFDSLGLMQSVPQLYVSEGESMSHNFLHLTVQEYLAALHISNMKQEEQVKLLEKTLEDFDNNSGRDYVVMTFYAGLTKLYNLTLDTTRNYLLEDPIDGFDPDNNMSILLTDVSVNTLGMNMMFEAHSDNLINSVLQGKNVQFSVSRYLSPLDYYCLGYCMVHSQSQWVLIFDDDNIIDVEGVRMLFEGANIREQNSVSRQLTVSDMENKLVRTGLGVGIDNSIGSSEMEVCTRVLPSLPLKGLHVISILLESKHCTVLKELISSCAFTEFCLSRVTLDSGDMESIIKSLTDSSILSLENLYLDHLSTCSTSVAHCLINFISESTTIRRLKLSILYPEVLIKTIAEHKSLPLEHLYLLFNCKLTDTATSYLAQFITNTTTLTDLHLYLDFNNPIGSQSLIQAMLDNKNLPLQNLHLECNFTETAVHSLAQFISNNSTLHYLQLKFSNEVLHFEHMEEGLESLTKALINNKSLPLVSLFLDFKECNDPLTTNTIGFLSQYISNSTTLQYIKLASYKFSTPVLLVLAQSINHCPRIIEMQLELELCCTVVGDEEVTILAQMLDEYPEVLDWVNRGHYLEFTGVTDKGAETIAAVLKDKTTQKKPFPFDKNIEGTESLAQRHPQQPNMTCLNLSNNPISDNGALALAQALQYNSTLQYLHLDGNNTIGEKGIHQLMKALTINMSVHKLYLPTSCKQYASKCTVYNEVKNRVYFLK